MAGVELDYTRARPPPGGLAGAGRAGLPPGVPGTLNPFLGLPVPGTAGG